jgi:uncharacterized protein YjiS (DUF1127 family)
MLHDVTARLRRLLLPLQDRRCRHGSLAELRALDDRLLDDVGITRTDIEALVDARRRRPPQDRARLAGSANIVRLPSTAAPRSAP